MSLFGGSHDVLLSKVFELLDDNRRLRDQVDQVLKGQVDLLKRIASLETEAGLRGGKVTIPNELAAELAAKANGIKRAKSQAEVLERLREVHGDAV